jgi:guanylate kinase
VSQPIGEPRNGPLLLVLSGPSGVGKDAVLDRMRQRHPDLYYAVTATTRPRRSGEDHGRDYLFVTREEFQQMLVKDELLEHAQVYERMYGVPRVAVREALARGQDVVLKLDVQGAATIRSKVPDAVLVFLCAPSTEELERRLRQRQTDSSEQTALRLETARQEMAQTSWFDHVLVNETDDLDGTVASVIDVLRTERLRVPPRHAQV